MEMPAKRILELGDLVLREVSRPVSSIPAVRPVLQDMRDTLHEFQRVNGFGRGISAVQIGDPVRLIYMEFQGARYCLHNPEYEYMSAETFDLWDDCFSFPDLLVHLERSEHCRIRYLDEEGREQHLEAAGALSELLQHEMDHLEGVLAVDRALDRNSFRTRAEHRRQKPMTAFS